MRKLRFLEYGFLPLIGVTVILLVIGLFWTLVWKILIKLCWLHYRWKKEKDPDYLEDANWLEDEVEKPATVITALGFMGGNICLAVMLIQDRFDPIFSAIKDFFVG